MKDTSTREDGQRYVLASLGYDAPSFDVEGILEDVHDTIGTWDFTRMDDETDDAFAVDYWRIVERHQVDQVGGEDLDWMAD